MLTHPDIADSAVIGVDDAVEATELPRYVFPLAYRPTPDSVPSAYVVHAYPEKIQTAAAEALFAQSVVKWMETQVAKHKFLRGGRFILCVFFCFAS